MEQILMNVPALCLLLGRTCHMNGHPCTSQLDNGSSDFDYGCAIELADLSLKFA
jgi:hypothetical protein